ncbi:hypothetical protein BX667DRAFT_497611 [Coemansia mojavensis]|nr:hypothetical protein BX667DRAFT_497611 [Coemansia mojavensis]
MTKPPLPLGYAHRVDKETGYDYYINMVTGESQWTLPRVSAYATSNVDMNLGMVDPDTVLPPHGYYDYSQQTAAERNRYQYAAGYNQYHGQQLPTPAYSWQQPGCILPRSQQMLQPHSSPHLYSSSYDYSQSSYSSYHRPKRRFNRYSSDISEPYQALTGALASGLAALGLHMFMDNDEREEEKEEQTGYQQARAVWYEEY